MSANLHKKSNMRHATCYCTLSLGYKGSCQLTVSENADFGFCHSPALVLHTSSITSHVFLHLLYLFLYLTLYLLSDALML